MPKDKDRPPHIVAAIERGDTEYLSQCGRNGARRTHQIKQAKKLAQARAAEEAKRAALAAQKVARERIVSDWWKYHVLPSNGHIIDPDGTDQNYCSLTC
jgi:hypothetical protein